MIDTNTDLSKRFFYVNPSATSTSDGARIFPMSRLITMNMVAETELILAFDDSGVGDHTIVKILITTGKGKEAIKDIVGAINSHQKVVVLADEYTGESIISDYKQERVDGVSVSITSGSAGTFALNGGLTVAGSSTHEDFLVGSETVASGALRTARGVSFLATTGTASFSLAAPDSSSGRIKYIVMTTAGGTGTLTIADAGFGGVGHVFEFANVGESLTLISMGSKWHVLSRGSGAVQAHNAVSGLPDQSNP